MQKSSLILLLLICFAAVFVSGCASTQSAATPVSTVPPAIPTTAQPEIPAPEPVTPAAPASSTAPASIAPTASPQDGGVSVTVNSAVKQTKIGNSPPPSPGYILLVLDITLQNNNKSENFDYTDASFQIVDKKNQKNYIAITKKITSGLNTPLSSGAVIMKSSKSGQIVFGILQGSQNNYKLNILSPTGTVLTSADVRVT